jgi:hypothetical protein
MLLGLLSFMLEDTLSTGCVRTTDDAKVSLARDSLKYNDRNHYYRSFGDLLVKARKKLPPRSPSPSSNIHSPSSSSSTPVKFEVHRENDGHGAPIVIMFAVSVLVLLMAALLSLYHTEMNDNTNPV